MSNTELNCCKCGKEFEFTERIYICGDLWQCEDCAIKKIQENDNKDKQIANLEAKLAESEEKLKLSEDLRDVEEAEYSEDIGKTNSALFRKCQQVSRLIKENDQLKQQLAEKNEILDWQNEIVEGVKQEEELLAQKLKSLGVDCIEDLGKENNQDKISFALEQLEKVKNNFNGKRPIDDLANEVGLELGYTVTQIQKYIDNQIKQLKEMKQDESI